MRIRIDVNNTKGKINAEIYGHFSEHLGRCIYDGLYVGENSKIPNVNGMRSDVITALKQIKIPVLRWPGGCFADEYHWRDGIGPKEKRKKMVNNNWGKVTEDNSFGTHEYMELCRQLGCKPYINGNLGSGTIREMAEWVEYLTFSGESPQTLQRLENGRAEAWEINYFGIGNENWGYGGNMRASYYADEYRRYQTFVRSYDPERPLYKIACGPGEDDYAWTREVMELCGKHMDGLSLHHYCIPGTWEHKGSAVEFDGREYDTTINQALFMEELICKNKEIMAEFDPEGRVGLIVDEWGTWFDVEPGTNPGFLYQQNTMRDALVAGITLNIFNRHCDRVKMANLAQTVNVLQAVLLTAGDHMVKTPTYHVFDLYQVHQEGLLLETEEENAVPNVTYSASKDWGGNVYVTLCNFSLEKEQEVELCLEGNGISAVTGRLLTGKMNGKNTFEEPERIVPENFVPEMAGEKSVLLVLPPCSVCSVSVRQSREVYGGRSMGEV